MFNIHWEILWLRIYWVEWKCYFRDIAFMLFCIEQCAQSTYLCITCCCFYFISLPKQNVKLFICITDMHSDTYNQCPSSYGNKFQPSVCTKSMLLQSPYYERSIYIHIYQKLQKYKIQKVAFTTRRLVMDEVFSDVKFYFYIILFLVPLGNCATNLLYCLN